MTATSAAAFLLVYLRELREVFRSAGARRCERPRPSANATPLRRAATLTIFLRRSPSSPRSRGRARQRLSSAARFRLRVDLNGERRPLAACRSASASFSNKCRSALPFNQSPPRQMICRIDLNAIRHLMMRGNAPDAFSQHVLGCKFADVAQSEDANHPFALGDDRQSADLQCLHVADGLFEILVFPATMDA